MEALWPILGVGNLILAMVGSALMVRRYLYLRHQFRPQEKTFWIGVAMLLAVLGANFVETLVGSVAKDPRVVGLTVALAVIDVALLRPLFTREGR